MNAHTPFPTPKALCHTARGCAGRRATPGPGHSAFPTPNGVVPSCLLGGATNIHPCPQDPPWKIYRAETPSRRESKFSFSAPLPLCARFYPHSRFSPGLQNRPHPQPPNAFPHAHLTKPVNAPTPRQSPSPTPTALCHKARGYAVPGVTPGMGGDDPTNHKVVVPKDRTGGMPIPHSRSSASIRGSPPSQHQRCAPSEPGLPPQEMVH